MLRRGIAWRLMPKSLPPRSTAQDTFGRWRDGRLFDGIDPHLVVADLERVGREASPTAAVLDSQNVKAAGSGGPPRTGMQWKHVPGSAHVVEVQRAQRDRLSEPGDVGGVDHSLRLAGPARMTLAAAYP